MTFDDRTLMAFVDGELAPDDRARVEAALATEPELRARTAALDGVRTAARDAFPITVDPGDAALTARIRAHAAGASPRRFVTERLFAPRLRRPALWAGLAAAGFAAGIGVGWFGSGSTSAGLVLHPGGMIANKGLVRVLDTRRAGDGADANGRRVNLTFRATGGEWCRTFVADRDGLAGLACRQDGHWQARVVTPWSAPKSEIRTAAAETPPAILAEVDALIVGETLGTEAEADLLGTGWRER